MNITLPEKFSVRHLIRLVFLCLLIALPAACPLRAEARRDILGSSSDYTAILYDSSNGLPTSEANAIVQSPDGFMWIGGYSGLIRYDGSNFYRFDSSTGISSVFSLFVDSKERVWIGTNENGIACFDHGDIKVYGRVEGLKSYSIRAITEDNDGNIIIATTQGLACIQEDLQVHVIDDPLVNLEYITALQKDEGGCIYGLTLNGAVFELDSLRISAFYNPEKFGEEPVNALYSDPGSPGILYMGTAGSELLTVDGNASMKIIKRQSTGQLKNINSILKINDLLWLSATNGIGYIDGTGVFTALSDVPMHNSVGHIMEDHEGNIWFTSTRQGVLKLVPDRFTDISKLAELEQTVVNSTCINGNNLYIATDSGLIIINSKSYNNIENPLTEYLKGVRIRCIKNDSLGRVWLCTHGETGLVCFNPDDSSITSYNETNGLDAARVRAVLERRDGSMAAATGNGLFIIKDGKVSAHYGQDDGISTTEILSVEEGEDGTLYLGSDGDGIYVIKDNRVSRIGHDDGLTSEVVMRIKRDDERGLFWLITSNSIQYMKQGSGSETDLSLTAVTNFPYSNNYDIYFNGNGKAWILSSNGIYITKVEELLDNKDIEYSFYDRRSGLPYIATGNSRSFLDDKGNLYISGTTGVCRVDINTEEGNTDSVRLAIPSVELDDRTVPVKNINDPVVIPAGSRKLVINAYAITFGLSNPRISYYLEGFDDAPVVTTKQEMQPVRYTNLDGGKYVFHLNVINDETGEIEKSASIILSKETSLYESFVFWAIFMVAIIALISFVIWKHFLKMNRELLAKQEEDQLFINEIMYTFAKCIDMRDSQNRGHSFRVAIYTKMLAEKLKEKREYTDEQISEFYNIALLHDIGKLSIPDSILNKPERLNDDEYKVMKSHAAKGAEILKDVRIVEDLAIGAGCHHERMDGRGYPRGLKGDEIPEVARIIAVADTFDAMYSTRPYRKQLDLSVVLEEIKRIRGTQLDEEVVDALIALAEENKIDKKAIDAAVLEEPQLVSMPEASSSDKKGEGLSDASSEKKQKKEELARKNREFAKSLGLYSQKEADEADKDNK